MPISQKIPGATWSKIVASLLRLRFSTLGGFTETLSAGLYSYSRATGTGGLKASSMKLAASTDGYVQTSIAIAGQVLMMASNNAVATYTDAAALFGMYSSSASGGTYVIMQGGANIGAPNAASIAFAAGDIARLRRVGSAWKAEVSKDAGATFTTIHNYANTSTLEVFPAMTNITSGAAVFGSVKMSDSAIAA